MSSLPYITGAMDRHALMLAHLKPNRTPSS